MYTDLHEEFQYYLDHQDEYVEKFEGKVVVIKKRQLLGVYNSEIEAVQETSKQEALGTFLVQRCKPGKDAYTATYNSRVSF